MTVRAIGVREHPESGLDRASRLVLGVGLLPIMLFAMLAFMAVVEQKFFGVNNIFNVLRSTSFLAILAAGQMLVLIVGGFDLSVGASSRSPPPLWPRPWPCWPRRCPTRRAW